MRPLYCEFNFHRSETPEEKAAVVKKLKSSFLIRMRIHREVTLREISDLYKVPLATLQQFEEGKIELSNEIAQAYIYTCGGQSELPVFKRLIQEFFFPNLTEKLKQDILLAAKLGAIVPGVDYKKLETPEGRLVPMRPWATP